MEQIVNKIITEYKKAGYINVYIIGVEGSGKTILSLQLLEEICNKLDIKASITMVDVVNNITSIKGINLIETYRDSKEYRFKVKVLIKEGIGNTLVLGFYQASLGGRMIFGRFKNRSRLKDARHSKSSRLIKYWMD